ncbi:hypothetical protein MELB17_24107 [Marinobacter sp. ELB17]|nr:hypothetical protein MELB17_24107 [Marinobacter sp. ELB17]
MGKRFQEDARMSFKSEYPLGAADVEIIDKSLESRGAFEKRTSSCASTHLLLTPEHQSALKQGKCIAVYDGEYAIFIANSCDSDNDKNI